MAFFHAGITRLNIERSRSSSRCSRPGMTARGAQPPIEVVLSTAVIWGSPDSPAQDDHG